LRILVGIPALNEERTIAKVVLRAKSKADEVLVVDDGSKDDTGPIAEALGARVVRHGRNLGRGAALRDCFEWAKRTGADVLVTLDADGQHDPSHIPKLVEALTAEKADVVIGSRQRRPVDMPRLRWAGKRGIDRLTGVRVGSRFADTQSGFKAYSRKAIEKLVATEFGMGADAELIMRADRAGMTIAEVPVNMSYAGLDTSSIHPLTHALDVILSVVKFVSIRHPMTFYGLFGFAALSISVIFGLWTLEEYQKWGRVITNLALVSVAAGIIGFLSVFTGIILFTLITLLREKS